MINEKHLTVIFHMDDLTHLRSNNFTDHTKLLDEVHGSQDPLTVTRGKAHEHIVMTIDFSLSTGV